MNAICMGTRQCPFKFLACRLGSVSDDRTIDSLVGVMVGDAIYCGFAHGLRDLEFAEERDLRGADLLTARQNCGTARL